MGAMPSRPRRSPLAAERTASFLLPLAAAALLATSACSDDSESVDSGQPDSGVADSGGEADTGTTPAPDASADSGVRRDAGEGTDAGPADTGSGPRSIVFLHTNDEHSHMLGFGPEIDDYPVPAPAANTEILGGVKRRARVLELLKGEAQTARTPVATIGAGDIMMGTLFHLGNIAGPTVPAVDYAVATALQYDVLTLGNHEFDFGISALTTALSTGGIDAQGRPGIMRIPIVVSNLRFSMSSAGDNGLAALYAPEGATNKPLRRTHVATFGTGARAVRVGFLGLMGFDAALVAPYKTPVRFSLPQTTTVCDADADCPGSVCLPPAADPLAAMGTCAATTDESDAQAVIGAMVADAAGAVAALRAQGVDLVVAVTHAGVDERELAALELMGLGPEEAMVSEDIVVVKGVDAALAPLGLAGIDVVIGGHSHTALATPLRVPNVNSGITTIIAQAGHYGKFVGKLRFNQSAGGEPWELDDAYSGLTPIDTSVDISTLSPFTDIVLEAGISQLIDGLENNPISTRGDNIIYPGEQCDGTFLPNGGSCLGLVPGATGGRLVCINNNGGPGDRQVDLSGCTFTGEGCGNSELDPNEMCDGAELFGQTCEGLGYLGGTLGCHANCTLDFSSCTPFFPSILEAALNFQQAGSPIRNNPAERGDLFFYRLGTTSFDLPSAEASHESNLMNLVTDSARWTLNQVDDDAIADPVRVAINANGVIRDPIMRGETGELSFSDLFRVLPLGVSPIETTPAFPLVDFYVEAHELKRALEIGVNQGLALDSFWLGVSGARVDYDPARPAGDRVTRVTLTDESSKVPPPPGEDEWLEDGPIYDVSLGAGEDAYPRGSDELIHVASNLYILIFAEALGICPRDATGEQYGECRACTTDRDCDVTGTTCNAAAGRCVGGNPVAFRVRSFAPVNSFGLFQEIKEFLGLIHYVRNLPNGGDLPLEYDEPVPRRMCCTGEPSVCPIDRVCVVED